MIGLLMNNHHIWGEQNKQNSLMECKIANHKLCGFAIECIMHISNAHTQEISRISFWMHSTIAHKAHNIEIDQHFQLNGSLYCFNNISKNVSNPNSRLIEIYVDGCLIRVYDVYARSLCIARNCNEQCMYKSSTQFKWLEK